ncbi:MAG: aminotransferase class III-fold pyridoxal phosphate-dependent enzyme [Alphaproteobacteria bacterium]|nr:aminotransferase class III-fold pyridoxal phosphate-dependent enzyme [Alphaproteobacteria bacterium]
MKFRAVKRDDAAQLFAWLNAPDRRDASFATRKTVAWTDHLAWLEARFDDPGSALWIAEDGNRPLGQVRLQWTDAGLEVSLYVAPEARKQGVGRALLDHAALTAARRWPGRSLIAHVRPNNAASLGLFRRAGYEETARADDYVTLSFRPLPDNAPITMRRFDRSLALHSRALNTIPTGSQTFSKSSWNFVKGATPLVLERGAGARIWDSDGNDYVDYVMSLLAIVLGYRDAKVDAAIRAQLERGISFSLATELEASLAERLRALIPCAEMARFAKNGSDATSGAIRLARAHTGRDKIALSGYHGWHDWYIGTTARRLGVPEAVQALSVNFPYNDADALERLLVAEPKTYAAVIMEPAGIEAPAPGFLERVRALTERHGVVLVFDEIITGFRIALGGAQAHYNVVPDLACVGKAMGNGMPISAVVGRKPIMRLMEDVFFSGTFGGETLSLAAALATIDKLERDNGIARIQALGKRLRDALGAMLVRRGLTQAFKAAGPDWWPRLAATPDHRTPGPILQSLMQQELAQDGVLIGAGLTLNLALAHDHPAVEAATLAAFDRAMARVAEALARPDPASAVRGEPIRPIFQVRPIHPATRA